MIIKIKKVISPHILLTLKIYLTGILFFFLFRLILFITELKQLDALPQDSFGLMFQAFIMGFRFDTTISTYIISIPFIILSLLNIVKRKINFLIELTAAYLFLLYVLSFLICAIDIPYFNQFFSRFSTAALAWKGSPGFVIKMIIEEPRYWTAIIPFLIFSVTFGWLLWKYFKRFKEEIIFHYPKRFFIVLVTILMIPIIFLGIRGRIAEKSPIRVGTAYFSNYAFPNMLGLNPVFTLMRSYLNDQKPENQELKLMDNKQAVQSVLSYLNINDQKFESPIAREIIQEEKSNYANVVLIIMENMSAKKMGRYGNPNHLTPFLDSLATKGYSFDNIYTSGIHTYTGVYSTLISYPVLFKQHPMLRVSMLRYNSIADVLKTHNYHSIYFTTHDDQFDNIGGFLSANGFDEIIAQDDYPSEKVLSTLGVPDHYLFEFSLPKLNELSGKGNPFLAVYMTASDHGPYIIPEDIPFKPKSSDIKQQIVEYADWSLSHFINLASKELWFDKTLFVFVADHGTALTSPYDMPLSYHHTPLIFYSPALQNSPRSIQKLGGQIDVFPTILGILNLPYINNTLGIDLMKESRPFIYFTADDKLGVLNQEYFLTVRNIGGETLYKYRTGSTDNLIEGHKETVDSMKNYAYCMLQTAQYIIKSEQTDALKTKVVLKNN